MKKVSYILTGIAAIFLIVSCEKQPEDNKQEEVSPFSILSSELSFGHEGGTAEVKFTAPGEWTVSSQDESWCTVSPRSGNGDGQVTVTVQELSDEEEDRATKVILSCGELSLWTPVVQSSNPDAFIISPTTVNLGTGEEDFNISVFSRTRGYEITIVDDWISLVSRTGDPKTGETLTFHAEAAEPNEDASPRVGIVSICTTDDAGTCIPVAVTQQCPYTAHVLAMRFTATWCGYCPYMDEAFRKAQDEEPLFEYVTLHASNSDLKFGDSGVLDEAYKIAGYPTGVVAGWRSVDNYSSTDKTKEEILKNTHEFIDKFPCKVKLQATASIQDGKIQVEASALSIEDAGYSIVAVVLESGIVHSQTYYPPTGGPQTISDFVHDNIVRYTLTDSITGDEFEAKASEKTEFSWSADLSDSWNSDNLSVAVWVCSGYGDLSAYKKRTMPNYYIANVCIVPVQ